MSLQQIADATDLSKPTVFRLLAALAAEELVVQDEVTGEYGLGPEVARLAERILQNIAVREAAGRAMRALRDQVNETVVLSVRRGDQWYDVEALAAGQSLSLTQKMGIPQPLHVGAPGIAFLAAMDPAERADYLAHEIPPQAQSALLARIAQAERQGYAISDRDFLPEVVTICECIADRGGESTAVLQVSFPKARDSGVLRGRILKALHLACNAMRSGNA